MPRYLFCLLLVLGFTFKGIAATEPLEKSFGVPEPATQPNVHKLLKLKVSEIEKLTGKKMMLSEKLRFSIARTISRVHPRFEEGEPTPKQIKQGKLSMILGLSAVGAFLIGLVVAPFLLLSLPLGIAALVLGMKSAKGNGNTQALIGIISGGAVIFVMVLTLIFLAILLASWGGTWG